MYSLECYFSEHINGLPLQLIILYIFCIGSIQLFVGVVMSLVNIDSSCGLSPNQRQAIT